MCEAKSEPRTGEVKVNVSCAILALNRMCYDTYMLSWKGKQTLLSHDGITR